MQYQGGKAKACKAIVKTMVDNGLTDQVVVEPFCGACHVTYELCRIGRTVHASDLNRSLIMMWQKALAEGVSSFPIDDYDSWKTAAPSAEKALVGYGASWGGKWFGGLARNNLNRDYLGNAVRSVNKYASAMRGKVVFNDCSYLDLCDSTGLVYYLDKPYASTTSHYGGDFDHDQFWEWTRERARENLVFVSEYEAPIGTCIMEMETPLSMAAGKNNKGRKQIERLFKI